jgi:hypothetical protein
MSGTVPEWKRAMAVLLVLLSGSGTEVALIEEFAEELGVAVEWRPLSAFAALEGLEQGEVDLAIGGFTQSEVSRHAGAALPGPRDRHRPPRAPPRRRACWFHPT